MKDFIKEASARWKAETPIFFRRIIRSGVIVGGMGGSLKVAQQIPGFTLPHFITAQIGHMVTAGIVAVIVAKFAKIDVSDIPAGDNTPKP